ncbi:MAG: hypothetical protein ACFFA0_02600 [Promethearchaeota archaeon]
MSKAVSYYDWKLSYQRKIYDSKDELNDNEPINALGIFENDFKDFIKNWKRKNLN